MCSILNTCLSAVSSIHDQKPYWLWHKKNEISINICVLSCNVIFSLFQSYSSQKYLTHILDNFLIILPVNIIYVLDPSHRYKTLYNHWHWCPKWTNCCQYFLTISKQLWGRNMQMRWVRHSLWLTCDKNKIWDTFIHQVTNP